jgi:hypothetical protein
MTSFTFTSEQIQSAPAEVRRWLVQEIGEALVLAQRPAHDPAQGQRVALATCSVEEAAKILERLRGNFLVMQLFFELAREGAPGRTAPALHVMDAAEILRHTRLPNGEGLVRGLEAINAAYREVSGDPLSTLFGFDDRGHVYVQEQTHLSIRHLWEQLSLPPATIEPSLPLGLAAPHLGPNQGVASHALERPHGEG